MEGLETTIAVMPLTKDFYKAIYCLKTWLRFKRCQESLSSPLRRWTNILLKDPK